MSSATSNARRPRPAASPAADESSAARARIVDAARQHFFTHGFRSVTMDDLAAELGMSKKTLYAHFTSKTALLEAVLMNNCARAESDLDRITRGCAGDFVGALRELLACVQRHTGEIQPAFIRDMGREAPETFGIIMRRRREMVERYFGRLLAEGRKAGFIRKDISVKLVLEILIGAANGVMIPPKMAELGLTPKTGFSAIISVILEGIVTTEGRNTL
jgi:AcrR family transcriptional regulator